MYRQFKIKDLTLYAANVMGILFIGTALTLLGNLLADISYALVDPRIRGS